MPLLSLTQLGMHELTPPELVSCAAEAGFDAINLTLNANRPGAAMFPIQTDTPMRRETLARLRDTGLVLTDVTSIWITPETNPADKVPLFEAAQYLGAKSFVVVGYDPDHKRATDTFARLCELAAPFGLTIDFEFMIYSEVKNLDQARTIVEGAAQPNGGILIDCLHVTRSVSPLESIKTIDPKYLNLFQLCDAPAQAPPPEGIQLEARANRLPAGQGGLPLQSIIKDIPKDIAISVEIPLGGQLALKQPRERAKLINDTARAFLRSTGRQF